METTLRKGQARLRCCKRKRTFASSSLLQFAVKWSQVTLFYLHQEPVYIRLGATLFFSRLSPPTLLRLFPPLAPLPTAFHVTARGGVAEGGATASLSGVFAAVWAQLSGCDKESIKTKRFHTNYGKIMKPLVKGRMKVRLSLV